MYSQTVSVETYKGEQYKLIHREILSFVGKNRKVWIYVVLTGPAAGMDGGKNDTKAEARKWARLMIKAGAEGTL